MDKNTSEICKSIDNLAKEVRDLKRILLRKSDIVIDGKKMKGLEDDGLDGIYISIPDHAVAYISVYEIGGDQE